MGHLLPQVPGIGGKRFVERLIPDCNFRDFPPAPGTDFTEHAVYPFERKALQSMSSPRLLLPSDRDPADSRASRIIDSLLNLLYPESCLACASPVSRARERGVCGGCWNKLLQLRVSDPVCPACGIPYAGFADAPREAHLCVTCVLSLPPFSGARAFGYYGSVLRRVIQALKFDGRRDLTVILAPLLASTFLEVWSPADFDLVVPIPLHPRRERERGYNQATLLAAPFGRTVGLPVNARALNRNRNTSPQVGLSDADRAHNVKHAFDCARPALVKGRRILLIDDVMTTGSTMASACDALLDEGAKRVSALTLARVAAGWE
jgi:ComF family protein